MERAWKRNRRPCWEIPSTDVITFTCDVFTQHFGRYWWEEGSPHSGCCQILQEGTPLPWFGVNWSSSSCGAMCDSAEYQTLSADGQNDLSTLEWLYFDSYSN